jgi:hypothetical protein
MKKITISFMDGTYTEIMGEANLDPIENAVVVLTSTGILRAYWPNVSFYTEQDLDDDA